MAMMRFRVPNPSEFDPRFWQTAFVAGLDALPIASVNFLQDDELVLEISSRDSCKLSMPWPTRDFGPIVLSTASLRTNQPTYHLLLELARGTLHRIRTDAFFWDRAGVRIPNSHTELIDQAADVFIQAILEKDNPTLSDALAQQSIDLAISAARPLARAYVTQNLHARIRNNEKLQTLFGVRLPSEGNWKDFAVPPSARLQYHRHRPFYKFALSEPTTLAKRIFDDRSTAMGQVTEPPCCRRSARQP